MADEILKSQHFPTHISLGMHVSLIKRLVICASLPYIVTTHTDIPASCMLSCISVHCYCIATAACCYCCLLLPLLLLAATTAILLPSTNPVCIIIRHQRLGCSQGCDHAASTGVSSTRGPESTLICRTFVNGGILGGEICLLFIDKHCHHHGR